MFQGKDLLDGCECVGLRAEEDEKKFSWRKMRRKLW